MLNPSKETDYGEHLFENPETHELIGTTAAGRYHIDILDLNHETFLSERRDRAMYLKLWGATAPVRVLGQFDRLQDLLEILRRQFERFIPYSPPPPRAG